MRKREKEREPIPPNAAILAIGGSRLVYFQPPINHPPGRELGQNVAAVNGRPAPSWNFFANLGLNLLTFPVQSDNLTQYRGDSIALLIALPIIPVLNPTICRGKFSRRGEL